MKKLYNTVVFMLLLLGQVLAQIPQQMDLIQSPRYKIEGPAMALIYKSGQGLSEIPIGAGWLNQSRFVGLQDARGNQIQFSSENWDSVSNVWVEEISMMQSITYDPMDRPATSHLRYPSLGIKN